MASDGHAGNKDEGALAFRVAKQAFEAGDFERAQRLAEKAGRLIPGQKQVSFLFYSRQRKVRSVMHARTSFLNELTVDLRPS